MSSNSSGNGVPPSGTVTQPSEPPIKYLKWQGVLIFGAYLIFQAIALLYMLVLLWPSAPSPATEEAINKTKQTAEYSIKRTSDEAIVTFRDTVDKIKKSPQDDNAEQINGQINKAAEDAIKKIEETTGDTIKGLNKIDKNYDEKVTLFGLFTIPGSRDIRLILLVVVAGALGSYIHTVTSFADYVGNRRLVASWIWWYILRGFAGLSLALTFYFVIRAGLFTAGSGEVSPFGVTAIACLVGMFSKQATDKLREIFDNLFKTDESVQRKDKLENPLPKIESISPETVMVGGASATILVRGSNFVEKSVARIKGSDRVTKIISTTEISFELLPADMATEGRLEVQIFNPPPGGGLSNTKMLIIAGGSVPPDTQDVSQNGDKKINPVPKVDQIVPSGVQEDPNMVAIELTGSNFIKGALVRINEKEFKPKSVTETKILVEFPPSISLPKTTVEVTVINPPPGGGTSAAINFDFA